MTLSKKLSEAEYSRMLQLLQRYVDTEMDQWALWKFDGRFSTVYISISMKPSSRSSESAYADLNHLL